MPKENTAITTIAIIGLGDRGAHVYGNIALQNPERMQVVAICDINPERLAAAQAMFGLPPESCFISDDEFLAQPRMADAMFVCTPDFDHIRHATAAIRAGYHVLLEKPVSNDAGELQNLLELSCAHNRKVCVCHVLRYTPFYSTIKELLLQGAIGRIISIQAQENIGYYHFAHSYVRGNWRNTDVAYPAIMAKCCHDLDLFAWLVDKPCKTVSSAGSLVWFTPEHAPEGAAPRCLGGCTAREDCPYDCEKIYISNPASGIAGGNAWPAHVVCDDLTRESLLEALSTGGYGRCVYACDNNVADHQQVTAAFEGGAVASLSMCAFTKDINRYMKIMGSEGEIEGDLNSNVIHIRRFDGECQDIDLTERFTDFSGHGGGDTRMVEQFIDYVQHGIKGPGITDLSTSVESHIMAVAAEESRKTGKTIQIAAQ